MDYSVQLYSVRDLASQSLEEALKQVAEIGYKQVEFAGFYGHTAEEVRAMLDKYGLEVSSIHGGFEPLFEDFDAVVEYNKKIGNKHYVLPSHDLSSQDKIDDFVKKVNVINKKLAEQGITFAFHNHTREFNMNPDGSHVYDQLIYRTDIQFEVDVYWAYASMKDPIALLERVKNRVTFIHLKDGTGEGRGTPLGRGFAPIKEVREWAINNGKQMIVESETLKPSGIEEVKICFDYLKTIE
jgi:sugar phosphate isomerase/epimerase